MQPSPNGVNGAARLQVAAMSLTLDAYGRLVLTDPAGERHVGVEPVRAFPLSDPTHWIALVDAEGHEVLCIESLDDLPPSARQTLEDELHHREFVPVIERVLGISGETFPGHWDIETDRGCTRIELDSEDDIRRIGSHRVLITDARKMRYQVPDTRALDAYSRRVLERYV
jgi:hypothetical protein